MNASSNSGADKKRRTTSTCPAKTSPFFRASDILRSPESRASARLISLTAALGDCPEVFSLHSTKVRAPEARQLSFFSMATSSRPRTAPSRETAFARSAAPAVSLSSDKAERSTSPNSVTTSFKRERQSANLLSPPRLRRWTGGSTSDGPQPDTAASGCISASTLIELASFRSLPLRPLSYRSSSPMSIFCSIKSFKLFFQILFNYRLNKRHRNLSLQNRDGAFGPQPTPFSPIQERSPGKRVALRDRRRSAIL